MKNIYCTHGRHRAPRALIHDMNVMKRVCLDCRALMLSSVSVITAQPRWNKALPSPRFRMIPR